jgi:hypothetical protein
MRLVSSANQQQQQQQQQKQKQQQQQKRVEVINPVHKATCKRKLSLWQLRLSKHNEIKTGCTFSSLLFLELESLVLLLLVKFVQNTRGGGGVVAWQQPNKQREVPAQKPIRLLVQSAQCKVQIQRLPIPFPFLAGVVLTTPSRL